MFDKGAEIIIRELNKIGYEGYIVGGAVRDYLMGRAINDYDITTNAKPDVIMSLPFKNFPSGLSHGTVTVVIDDKNYEVTTYRIETDYYDHRHPSKVEFSSILRDDLKRRDFTINALAYDINTNKVIDCFSGIKDIDNKLIRCVGNPYERFEEDALRILRSLRFAATLDFSIEELTSKAINEKYRDIKYISRERVNVELSKLIVGNNAPFILKEYAFIFNFIIPEISMEKFVFLANNIEDSSNDLIIRLSILLSSVKDVVCVMKSLRYPNITTIIVNNFIECYKKSFQSKQEIYEIIKQIRLENMPKFLSYLKAMKYSNDKFTEIIEL